MKTFKVNKNGCFLNFKIKEKIKQIIRLDLFIFVTLEINFSSFNQKLNIFLGLFCLYLNKTVFTFSKFAFKEH